MAQDPLISLRATVLATDVPLARRQAALRSLEDRVARQALRRIQTPITRSARLGRRRRGLYVSELERLEPFAEGRSIGDVVTDIARALIELNSQPQNVDFGWDQQRGPVVSVTFIPGDQPKLDALEQKLVSNWPNVTAAYANPEPRERRKILLFLHDQTKTAAPKN